MNRPGMTVGVLGFAMLTGCADRGRPAASASSGIAPVEAAAAQAPPPSHVVYSDTDWLTRELNAWRQPANHLRVPESALAMDADPVGRWTRRGAMHHANFVVAGPPVDGIYDVSFAASGCLDRWTLKRSATFSRGVLVLDRAVREYPPVIYQRLYAIRVGSEIAFLPATEAGLVGKRLSIEDARYVAFLNRDWAQPEEATNRSTDRSWFSRLLWIERGSGPGSATPESIGPR